MRILASSRLSVCVNEEYVPWCALSVLLGTASPLAQWQKGHTIIGGKLRHHEAKRVFPLFKLIFSDILAQ